MLSAKYRSYGKVLLAHTLAAASLAEQRRERVRTTQLSLERPAISSRGQWIAELASSTSEVAYTYVTANKACACLPNRLARQEQGTACNKAEYTAGLSQQQVKTMHVRWTGGYFLLPLHMARNIDNTPNLPSCHLLTARRRTLMRRDTPAVAKNSSSRSKLMEHSMSLARTGSPACSVARTCRVASPRQA